jgi:hypothetical protein
MIDESFCLALSEIGNVAILLDACIKEGTFTNPEGLITASVRDYQDNLPRFHDHIERLRKKLKKRP